MSPTDRRLSRLALLLMVFIVAASGTPATTQGRSDQAPAIGNADAQFVPNELLVQFRGDATPNGRADARAIVGGRFVETVVEAGLRSDGKGATSS